MHLPLVFHFLNHPIYFHLITDFLSTSIGAWLYWRTSKSDGISNQRREYLLFGAALGALIGSRLIGALENPQLFLHPPALLYYYASKTIIGGIAGGILGIEAAKRIIGHRASTGDRITIPLLVAIFIGRIGCLFTGVTDGTVGNPCQYLWCFSQGDGIPRHPTSLYEIVFLVALFFLLRWLSRQSMHNGILFRTFIVLYFSFRFMIEYIKPGNQIILSLTVIQVVCLLYVLWYAYDIQRIIHTPNESRRP